MKKLFLLFVLLLFFTSCNSIVDSNGINEKSGTLRKIEVSTWMYGTHTLDDESGRPVYALTSKTIDLSLYENKKVVVSGDLVKGYPVDGGPVYLNVTNLVVIE